MDTNTEDKFVYHFYRRDRKGEEQFICSLMEKRKRIERITHASIMNWARIVDFKDVFEERVYFIRQDI